MNNKYFTIGFIIFLLGMVSAQIPVPIPHAFYGNITYVGGESIEQGIIIAKLNNTEVARKEFNKGYYNIIVLGLSGDISFYLEGRDEKIAEHPFIIFEVTELNIEILPTSSTTSRKSSSHKKELVQFCDVNWKCSGWGECINGLMTRQCYDENYCDYAYNKPLEKTGCELISKVLVEEEKGNLIFILFGVIITLILLIILISLLHKK